MKTFSKKLLLIVLAVLCVFCCVALAACSLHDHTFSEKWSADEEYHWHSATCEHTSVKGEQAEHTWDNGAVVVAATEEKEGVMRYTCTVCSKQKTEPIDKLPHTHVFKNVKKDEFLKLEADCVNAAVYFKSCACGEVSTDTFEIGNPLGHDFGSWIYKIDATCTQTGTVGHYHCARCQVNFDANYTEIENIAIDIKEHSYTTENPSSQYLKSAADCTQPAVYFYSCVCGSMGDKTFEYGEVAEHEFGNGVVTLPATETSTGVRTFTCAVCSTTKTEVIGVVLPKNQPIYELDAQNSTYVVVGFNGAAEEVVVPATYNGLRVSAIGEEAFANNSTIKKVVLPNSISAIGAMAFKNCSSLEEVNVPESVAYIGQESFYLCTKLERVQFSDKENLNLNLYVGDSAFSCCISMKEVVLAPNVISLGNCAFENCCALERISLNTGLTGIGDFAFDGCSALTEVVLPESVLSVGVGAFRNTTALTDVTLSPSMTTIENSTFHNCKSLKQIDLLANVTMLGDSAFSNCEALETINVLGNIGYWGNNAFYQCVKLSEINWGVSVSVPQVFANNYVFYNAGTEGDGITLKLTTNTNVPANLFNPVGDENLPKITKLVFEVVEGGSTSILRTYASLPFVETVELDSQVMRIAKGAFDGCPNLQYNEQSNGKYLGNEANPYHALITVANTEIDNVDIASTCVVIADSALENCENLTAITVPNSVQCIGYAAFNGCNNLVSITLPFVGAQREDSDYTNFGYAFGASNSATNAIFVPSTLKEVVVTDATSIGEGAFSGCSNLESLTIPFVGARAGVTADDAYQYPFGYIFGTTRFDDSQAATQYYHESSRFSTTTTTYYLPTSLNTVRVTGGNILYGAFSNCAIGNIVIESPVTEIGDKAFNFSSVTNVTLPDSVEKIGTEAFYGCGGITNIQLPSGLKTIADYAFKNCTFLTEIEIPSGVQYIGSGSFYGCRSLESMTIPFVGARADVTADDAYQYPFGYIFGSDSVAGTSEFYKATAQSYYESSTFSTTTTTYYVPVSLNTVRVTGGNILYGAFSNCAIKNVVIESPVTEIGARAFSGSGVVNVTLPVSVKTVGNYAFYGCTGIKNITLPADLETIGSYAFYDCSGFENIVLPQSVTSIGDNAFSGCSKLSIVFFMGSEEQWANVSVGTNSKLADVKKVFNYDGSKITVSFVTNCDENVASVTAAYLSMLPTVSKDGYVFDGWYDNAELSGSKVSAPYYSKEKTTLYAKWISEEEWLELRDGSSFAKAIIAQSGSTYQAKIDAGGQRVYFEFTPTTSGSYTIQSTGSGDTYGYLYNASQSQLTYNNDGGTNYNFKITYTLTAGNTYYVVVRYYYSSTTGTFNVSFS